LRVKSGFELVHKIDLSDRAYPSEDYIFEGLHKYKNRLCIDLNLEASMGQNRSSLPLSSE
jgi:hypothetical protein